MELVFANWTDLSCKALQWLQGSSADAVLVAETHWNPSVDPRGPSKIRSLHAHGWRAIIGSPEPSRASARGSYGGVMAAVKSHLHFLPLPCSEFIPNIRASAVAATSPYLVGFQLRLQGFDIWVFGSYHRGGLNPEVLRAVARYTLNGTLPFILMGDFNDTVDAIYNIG